MTAGNLAKCQSYDTLRHCLCSLLVKQQWLFVGILYSGEQLSWTVPKAFNTSCIAAGQQECSSLLSQRGTLTHTAPSECRRSSLHLPPSVCRILAPDQTPQMTALSPKHDAHKGIIRNGLFRRALNTSPF